VNVDVVVVNTDGGSTIALTDTRFGNAYTASYIDGQGGNDNITGAAVAVTGSLQADILLGSSGNDKLDGGLGNDTLTGGAGQDAFVFKKGYGADVITDFRAQGAGQDVLALDIAFSKLIFTAPAGSGNTVITSSEWATTDSLTLLGFTGTVQSSWITIA
jgi:Ca2+-binding RTX toxin-like protein